MSAPLRTTTRLAASAGIGAAVLGALAACASGTAAGTTSSAAGTGSGAAASSGTSSTSAGGATSSSSSGAKDGTYTESAGYQTPGGAETISVTLTVKNGSVTAVKVTGSPTTPNATHYQAAFESGISGVVVGKPLAGLSVGAVSGSSLTGNGFNAAVAKIRADAA